jgi:hypothetical protein
VQEGVADRGALPGGPFGQAGQQLPACLPACLLIAAIVLFAATATAFTLPRPGRENELTDLGG